MEVAPHLSSSFLSPSYFYVSKHVGLWLWLTTILALNARHYNAIIVKPNVNTAHNSPLACLSTIAGLQCSGPKYTHLVWPWRDLPFRARVSYTEPPTISAALQPHTFRGTSALPELSMDSQQDIILPQPLNLWRDEILEISTIVLTLLHFSVECARRTFPGWCSQRTISNQAKSM